MSEFPVTWDKNYEDRQVKYILKELSNKVFHYMGKFTFGGKKRPSQCLMDVFQEVNVP